MSVVKRAFFCANNKSRSAQWQVKYCQKADKLKAVVKWNKNAYATGYVVRFYNGSKTVDYKITKNTILSKTFSSLTKGKTVKVYVRSYRTVGSATYYSGWSAVKSVKIQR